VSDADIDGDAVRARIVTIISSVTRAAIRPDGEVSRAAVPEWDSLAHVEILFAVEEEFGIEFDEAVMKNLASADDLTEQVLRSTGQPG
jgi:acyl carrier protein